MDPVCCLTCFPQLLHSFVYKAIPIKQCLSSLMGFASGVRYVFSRDLIISEVSNLSQVSRLVSLSSVIMNSSVNLIHPRLSCLATGWFWLVHEQACPPILKPWSLKCSTILYWTPSSFMIRSHCWLRPVVGPGVIWIYACPLESLSTAILIF